MGRNTRRLKYSQQGGIFSNAGRKITRKTLEWGMDEGGHCWVSRVFRNAFLNINWIWSSSVVGGNNFLRISAHGWRKRRKLSLNWQPIITITVMQQRRRQPSGICIHPLINLEINWFSNQSVRWDFHMTKWGQRLMKKVLQLKGFFSNWTNYSGGISG